MLSIYKAAAAVLALSITALACPSPAQIGDITMLAYDDLNTNDTSTISGALMLSNAQPAVAAQSVCAELGETLWSPYTESFTAGLNSSLNYEVYAGRVSQDQLFWIAQKGRIATCRPTLTNCQAMAPNGSMFAVDCNQNLPVLCTNTAPASNISYANTAAPYQIQQTVGNQALIGFRDFLTFRFLGIRFAAEPARFTYSTLYNGTGVNEALHPAPMCLQLDANPNPLPTFNNVSTSEDCLFLNVFTTKLPGSPQPAKEELKPVMVYIYGGGFATGSASNPTNDGGNLAGRGDVVTVDLAYRLSTIGFLALDDGVHNGNYWLSDIIAGLEWVQKNIVSFGGDPSRVTVFGESAGATAVMTLLSSPKAAGLFHAAILQSNNFLQQYIPISTAYNETTVRILNETGCLNASDQLACLQAYNGTELLNLTTTASTQVEDGYYLTTPMLDLNGSDCSNPTNSVPLLISFLRDEAGIIDAITPTTDLNTGISALLYPNTTLTAEVLANADLFPLGSDPFDTHSNVTLEVYNTTTRIGTDTFDRCSSEAGALGGVANGIFPSVYAVQWNRSYQDPGYNSYGVCLPLPVPGYPHGNPTQDEYFKCHAGDLSYNFGNVVRVGFPLRDANDLPFMQLTVDYWTAFARSGGNPNPDMGYLQARGYWNTIGQIQASGEWLPVNAQKPQFLNMMWNSYMMDFVEEEQCRVLGQPLEYFLE